MAQNVAVSYNNSKMENLFCYIVQKFLTKIFSFKEIILDNHHLESNIFSKSLHSL